MARPGLNINQKIYIRANYLKLSSRQLSQIFKCSKSAVRSYLKKIGLKVPKEVQKRFRSEVFKGRSIFTPDQDSLLIEKYLQVPEKTLAVEIGVSSTCLRTRMRQLRLKVPVEIVEQRKKASQFSKGRISHNKGKKMTEFLTPEQIKKIKKTQFKKGHKPHNTLKGNGHIRIRRDNDTGIDYKYIKISDSNWQLLSRTVWEKHNGPVPTNCVVIFKDGNSLNCHISNLECITQKENALRNTIGFHTLPSPLKKAIRLNNKLKKALK